MKFSVVVNDSPRHIVNARSSIGAVKVATSALERLEEMPDADVELTIVVKQLSLMPKSESALQEKQQ